MFDFESILRGYSSEQYSEAMVFVLANFLAEKGLIDMGEFKKYYIDNLNEALEQIIKRDREIVKEKMQELEKERD